MHNTEEQELMTTIIEQAQSGQCTEFRFIRSWSEYRFYRGKRRSFKLLVRALQSGTERLFKSYCDSVIQGSSNFVKLLAYQQMQQIIKFYKTEIETITYMIHEYEAYLTSGHFFWAFLGGQRVEEDLVDFRGRF